MQHQVAFVRCLDLLDGLRLRFCIQPCLSGWVDGDFNVILRIVTQLIGLELETIVVGFMYVCLLYVWDFIIVALLNRCRVGILAVVGVVILVVVFGAFWLDQVVLGLGVV